jgi:hypothetical protein
MRRPPVPVAWPTSTADAATQLALLTAPSMAAAAALPSLYDAYTHQGSGPGGALLLLLLAKRLTLYSVATSTVYVAARRSADASPGLGARLECVTADGLYPFEMSSAQATELKTITADLDESSEALQAAALPVLFGGLLVGAYAFNTILAGGIGGIGVEVPPVAGDAPWAVVEGLRDAVKSVQPFSTGSVCFFALNAELQAMARATFFSAEAARKPSNGAGGGGQVNPATLATACLALASVCAAFVLPAGLVWPAQNAVNAAIAISVTRVLQLDNLGSVCAALVGLTLYDGLGTLAAVGAVDDVVAGAGALADASMMEQVARWRLGGGSEMWQPGLMTIFTQGRPTDAIGLGDIVIPSILAGWAHRFDRRLLLESGGRGPLLESEGRGPLLESGGRGPLLESEGRGPSLESEGRGPLLESPSEGGTAAVEERVGDGGEGGGYLAAVIQGYAVGCVLLEVVPPDVGRAALLCLVPTILTAVLGRLILRGELERALRV